MPIDPVLAIAEDLRLTQSSLRSAIAEHRQDEARKLSRRIRQIEDELLHAFPMSAPGAGELLRFAAGRFAARRSNAALHLRQIAARLSEGIREHADLVWLRALAAAPAGTYGPWHSEIIALTNSAIIGAARPVLIYRAALPLNDRKTRSCSR